LKQFAFRAHPEVSLKNRSQVRRRLDQIVTASPPTQAELHGQRVFIADEVFAQHREALLLALRAFAATKVSDEAMAHVFVVQDVGNAGSRISLAASLVGAWILTASAFCIDGGAAVKLAVALAAPRTIWASSAFRQRAEWILLLETVSEHSKAHKRVWKVLGSAADWALAKAKLDAAKRSGQQR